MHVRKDSDGRFIFIFIYYLYSVLITILSDYAPPGSAWKFYKHIFELIISEAQGLLVCGGDFNIRLNSFIPLDLTIHRKQKLQGT